MNKVFLAVLVFGFAIAAAAPSNEKIANPSQSEVNKEAVQNLANLVDILANGKSK